MFDIGASELLVIVVIAIIVIGPKELPLALRTAGRWIGKVRRVSAHFRSGLDTMIREAELDDMDRKWKEQNAKIMAKHPKPSDAAEKSGDQMEPLPQAKAEAASPKPAVTPEDDTFSAKPNDEPALPFEKPDHGAKEG